MRYINEEKMQNCLKLQSLVDDLVDLVELGDLDMKKNVRYRLYQFKKQS